MSIPKKIQLISGLPQADMAEADETKTSYVKNKPVVDAEISDSSENAVRNKVIKSYFDTVSYKKVDKEDIEFYNTEIFL